MKEIAYILVLLPNEIWYCLLIIIYFLVCLIYDIIGYAYMELAEDSKSISVFEIRRNKIISFPPEYIQAEELDSIALISRQFQFNDLDLNKKSSSTIKQLKDNCVEVLIKNATFEWDRKLDIEEIIDNVSDNDEEKEVINEHDGIIDDDSDNDEEEEVINEHDVNDVPLLENKIIQDEAKYDIRRIEYW